MSEMSKKVWINEKDWNAIVAQLRDAQARIAVLEKIAAAAKEVADEGWGWCSEPQHFERMAKMDRLRAALAGSPAVAEPCAVVRLLNVARGCHDYGGGYRDPKEAEVFHHGIQTVINSLESAAKNDPDNYQVNVLEQIGAAQKAAESTPAEPQKGDDK